jgi:hypothetical protein
MSAWSERDDDRPDPSPQTEGLIAATLILAGLALVVIVAITLTS